MARGYAIVCDSTADLTAPWYDANDVEVVPLKLHLPRGVASDVTEITPEMAEDLLDRRVDVAISQPSVAEFQGVFQRLAREGFDEIACVCTSEVVSTTQANARIAAKAAAHSLSASVEVIDSKSISAGEGMIVCDLVRSRAKDTDFTHAVAHARELARHISTLVVMPPGHAVELLRNASAIDRLVARVGRGLGIWALAVFDASGMPKVVARSRDPEQLAELASSLTAVDGEREGGLAHATFLTEVTDHAMRLVESLSIMLSTYHDLGTLHASGAVSTRLGLGAVGLAYAPERYCVTDPDLPLFRPLSAL